jgi:hypothetical protein
MLRQFPLNQQILKITLHCTENQGSITLKRKGKNMSLWCLGRRQEDVQMGEFQWLAYHYNKACCGEGWVTADPTWSRETNVSQIFTGVGAAALPSATPSR